MVDLHHYHDGFLSLAILALCTRPFTYLSPQPGRDPCHTLCPKIEQFVDIVTTSLQLEQGL